MLHSNQINYSSINDIFALNYIFQGPFFGFVLDVTLTVVTWVAEILIRWLVDEHLAELIGEELLLWRQQSYSSTHLKSLTLDEFKQIKLL